VVGCEGLAPLPRSTVLLADESSMTSTTDLDALRFLAASAAASSS